MISTLRTNAVSSEDTQEYIQKVLELLSNRLSLSLGPHGSTAIIQNEQLGHFMTKDGYTILKSLRFNDPIAMTILQIIQDISTQLVMKVGDGSTSSIIAAQCLYDELKSITEYEIRPKEVLDSLNHIVDLLVEELKEYKRDISDDLEEIKYIASISLNNDFEIGEMIAEIYKKIGKSGFINIKVSDSDKTYYTKTDGFQIDFGYLDKILVNNTMDECELINNNILMFNGPVNDKYKDIIMEALKEVEMRQESLTIIAPNYSSDVAAFFRGIITYNYRQAGRKSNMNIIKFPLATEHDENSFYDLSVKTGARIIQNRMGDLPEKETINEFFGKADRVVSNYKTTSFLGSHGNEDQINIRIGNIKNELKILNESLNKDMAKRYELQKRLAILEDKLYTIHIGGKSEHAKMTDKYLIEDAISACKSAIKFGYVIGGNLSIPICIKKLMDKLSSGSFPKDYNKYKTYLAILENAFRNVYLKVLENKFKDKDTVNEIYQECISREQCYDLINADFTDKTIINSVETEIEILKNVTSIISLLLVSNQFITINATNEIQ